MAGYFDKRKKQKLYQQWVDKSGLPPDSIPEDIMPRDEPAEMEDAESRVRRPAATSGLALHLTVRHLLYLVLATAVLLVSTATLATILAMRSC